MLCPQGTTQEWIKQLGSFFLVSCSGKFYIWLLPSYVTLQLTIYRAQGRAVAARLDVSTDRATLLFRLKYGSAVVERKAEVVGSATFYPAPNLYYGGVYLSLSGVEAVDAQGRTYVPLVRYVDVDAVEVEVDLQHRLSANSFLHAYRDGVPFFSVPESVGDYKAKFIVPAAQYYSLYAPAEGTVYYGQFTDYTSPQYKTGMPYPYFIFPDGAPPAAAAALTLADIGNAFYSFFGSLATGAAQALGALVNGLSYVGQVVWNGLATFGASVARAAYGAFSWAVNTKVEIGPFSISVADLATTIGLALVTYGAGAIVARGVTLAASRLLPALIGSSEAVATVSRALGVAAGALTVFAIDKAVGETDRNALIDALGFGLTSFFGWKGLIAAVGAALAFGDNRPTQLQEDNQIATASDYANAKAVVDLCFDPYYSILPISECQKAAAASPVPMVKAWFEGQNLVLYNPTGYSAEVTVVSCLGTKTVTVPPGGKVRLYVPCRATVYLGQYKIFEGEPTSVRPPYPSPTPTPTPLLPSPSSPPSGGISLDQLLPLFFMVVMVAVVLSVMK